MGPTDSPASRQRAPVAAHLVDRVLPPVPVRQWVLSLPFDLRALAAFRADVLSALSRIFVEAVFARHRACARHRKLGDVVSGAVTHVQRFGSSINLNVHFHLMVLDGVFIRDPRCTACGGRLRMLGEITEHAMVRLVLESIGLPTEAPFTSRARDPTDLIGAPEVD
jgi:hypothetical protein